MYARLPGEVGGGVSPKVQAFAAGFSGCYKHPMRDLRDWMREKMRRRSRRGPNDSESTGKIGQELPANQLAPLRPTYPDPLPVPETTAAPEVPADAAPQPVAVTEPEAPVAEKKMIIE